MMVMKCKMCGGDIEVNHNMTVGTCTYCGSTMTLPRIDTEKKARLFNWANQYRLNNEFDQAYEAYKLIIAEDEQEPEAYWGMLLSEYGVEYVEDPKTRKMIPTCHRTKTKSVRASINYQLAFKNADIERKLVYQDEAEEIDRIQKSILAISANEEPYDVFICYKETAADTNERTNDSVIAQEIYNALVKEGIRVFFSRITLESKLGKDFEPYIFSALSSAKVMLVVTTSSENVNSIWVKNEWSRYLDFACEDNRKTIIPVYKDMEIYGLPDELQKYQGQNYAKIGALQDVVHSVCKLVDKKETILHELVKEKDEREEKESQKKKKIDNIKKILLKGLIMTICLLFAYIGFRMYQKTIPIETMEIEVSMKNIHEYVEIVSVQIEDYAGRTRTIWILENKLYDEGWVIMSRESPYESSYYIVTDTSEFETGYNVRFENYFYFPDSVDVKINEFHGKLKYVNINSISKYKMNKEGRYIKLKNGEEFINIHTSDFDTDWIRTNY